MRWTLWQRETSEASSVRRNRVVLISRRWDYAGDDACASRRQRWLTSPDTGENTYKPQHHRAGNAGCFGVPVVTCLRAFLLLHARLRVRLPPGIPHALFGRSNIGQPGRNASRGCDGVSDKSASSLRTQGPITTALIVARKPSDSISLNRRRGVWVPARASLGQDDERFPCVRGDDCEVAV